MKAVKCYYELCQWRKGFYIISFAAGDDKECYRKQVPTAFRRN